MTDIKLCKICGWQIVQSSSAGLWLDADAYDCGDDGHFHEPVECSHNAVSAS